MQYEYKRLSAYTDMLMERDLWISLCKAAPPTPVPALTHSIIHLTSV